VMQSSYWNSTVIFVTWDEGGGFYDHVVPPKIFTVNHGFSDPLLGLGQRVPLLVISPYSRLNYVSHLQLSHLSLLHFVEFNWSLNPLNDLVAAAIQPMDFFNFSQTPRPGLILGIRPASQTGFPIPLQKLSQESVTPRSWLELLMSPVGIIAAATLLVLISSALLLTLRKKSPGRQTGGLGEQPRGFRHQEVLRGHKSHHGWSQKFTAGRPQ